MIHFGNLSNRLSNCYDRIDIFLKVELLNKFMQGTHYLLITKLCVL